MKAAFALCTTLTVFFFAATPFCETTQKELVVYVVAHVDDWQLFMGDDIASDIRAGKSVVIIQTIMEDPSRCWVQASVASLVVAVDKNADSQPDCAVAPGNFGAAECRPVEVNSHRMEKCTRKNATEYFLGIPASYSPESDPDPEIGELRDGQTLKRLQKGIIQSLGSVDKGAIYTDFNDVVATLTKIVETESVGHHLSSIRTQDPDTWLNPSDHIDHTTTGCAVALAFTARPVPLRFYVGYDSENRPASNLSSDDLDLKRNLFSTFVRVTTAYARFSGPRYPNRIQRKYYRDLPSDDPSRRLSGLMLLYNSHVGTGTIIDLQTRCERLYLGWRTSWNLLLRTNLFGKNGQFLLYSRAQGGQGAGAGALIQLGPRYRECTFDSWQGSWKLIAPIDFAPTTTNTLLFYNPGSGMLGRNDGSATVRKIAGCGVDVPASKVYIGWRSTWSAVASGSFVGGEHSDVALYDPQAAQLSVWYLPPDGGDPQYRSVLDVPKGDWMVTSGQFGGDQHTDLLMYDPQTGSAQFMISDGHGGFTPKSVSPVLPAHFRLFSSGSFWQGHATIAACGLAGDLHFWTITDDTQLKLVASGTCSGGWTDGVFLDGRE